MDLGIAGPGGACDGCVQRPRPRFSSCSHASTRLRGGRAGENDRLDLLHREVVDPAHGAELGQLPGPLADVPCRSPTLGDHHIVRADRDIPVSYLAVRPWFALGGVGPARFPVAPVEGIPAFRPDLQGADACLLREGELGLAPSFDVRQFPGDGPARGDVGLGRRKRDLLPCSHGDSRRTLAGRGGRRRAKRVHLPRAASHYRCRPRIGNAVHGPGPVLRAPAR
jgi:hypothetical protein